MTEIERKIVDLDLPDTRLEEDSKDEEKEKKKEKFGFIRFGFHPLFFPWMFPL